MNYALIRSLGSLFAYRLLFSRRCDVGGARLIKIFLAFWIHFGVIRMNGQNHENPSFGLVPSEMAINGRQSKRKQLSGQVSQTHCH
jgi:hypothetical protein